MTRIIAGRAGGRRLNAPKGSATRPTSDRTKEALFSALADWFGTGGEPGEQQLVGVRVLDLYAGSGAIGIEAASRGAESVTAIEAGREAAAVIGQNAKLTGLPIVVAPRKVATFLDGVADPVDWVFADPPYDHTAAEVDAVLNQLIDGGWLRPNALVVVERSRRSENPNWPNEFADTWLRHYGETTLHFGTTQPAEG